MNGAWFRCMLTTVFILIIRKITPAAYIILVFKCKNRMQIQNNTVNWPWALLVIVCHTNCHIIVIRLQFVSYNVLKKVKNRNPIYVHLTSFSHDLGINPIDLVRLHHLSIVNIKKPRKSGLNFWTRKICFAFSGIT